MGRSAGWIAFGLALALPSWTFAETRADVSPRVRGSSPEITQAIERAFEQSPTFRKLVAAIGGTDGIVYAHYGECGRNALACLVLSVTQAGPNRILQIRVDPRRKGHDLMVSIGHELQHALELLNEPTVVNYSTAHNFFERTAPKRGNSFETQAAVKVGLKIDGELRRWAETRARGPRAGDAQPSARLSEEAAVTVR
jgi:hypothetical protein